MILLHDEQIERMVVTVMVVAVLFLAGAGAWGAYYLQMTRGTGHTGIVASDNRELPVGWNEYRAELINLDFSYPAQWGTPEEDVTAHGNERQYILSFANAPTIFAGSFTDGYRWADPLVKEVAASRVVRDGNTVQVLLGDALKYIVTEYKTVRSTQTGETGFGNPQPVEQAGFEEGDRVGIVSLDNSTFQVLVFHFHTFASDQEVKTLLGSVRFR